MRLNTVVLSGSLATDPAPGTGKLMVASFLLSFAGPYGTDRAGGERRRDVVSVVAFGTSAETCLRFLRKGSKVVAVGRLREDRWGGPASGSHSRITIVADQVHFISGIRKPDPGDGSSAPGHAAPSSGERGSGIGG